LLFRNIVSKKAVAHV